jgi:hypothetical protein
MPKSAPFADRAWRIIAADRGAHTPEENLRIPLDPELVARYARDRKAAAAERNRQAPAVLIGPQDPPVNVLGGYLFADAPGIDLHPTVPRAYTAFAFGLALITTIPEDLSVPGFLRVTAESESKKRDAA